MKDLSQHHLGGAGDDSAETRRTIVLEERLAFQQKLLDDLNEVALQQQQQIERLQRDVAELRRAVDRAGSSGAGESLPYEKPPHY